MFYLLKLALKNLNMIIEHFTKIRVRYSDTDQMGYAHHGCYISYFEVGRVELLRAFNISYKKMEENGIIMPVRSFETVFYKAAKFDDLLIIRTYLKEPPSVKMNFYYEVFNEQKTLLSKGSTILVFADAVKKTPIKPPQYILEIFKNLL